MPSKNVYVAESDLPMFERASHLAGGMSAAVAAGLRLYLAQHEKNREGAGRLLLRRKQNEGLRTRTFSVYATARGQYAVHTRDEPDWSRMSAEDDKSPLWENQETWEGGWWNTKHRELHVFRDITGMRGEMPDYLIDEIERAESQPMVEDLDI